MRSILKHTSPFVNIRKAGPEPSPAWSFRMGVGIDVKFGVPKYDCRFHGICRLDTDETDLRDAYKPRCGRGKAWLFIPHPDYCLIVFDSNSLTEKTRQLHFERDYFELEEAVAVSDSLAGLMGRRLLLNPGRYRIMEKEKGYGVLFKISFLE